MNETNTIKLKGTVISGVFRGGPLVKIYFHRLIGILRFEPFQGTLDIKLEKDIKIEQYATKTIEHILMDGTRNIDAHLAPVILTAKGQGYDCWAMRETKHIHTHDIIELIAKDNLREKFDLKDGDEVEITFFEKERVRKELPGTGVLKKLYGREPQLTK